MKYLKEFRDYFFDLHDNKVNQKYADTLPYSFHLEMVYNQAKKFSYLIKYGEHDRIYISCYAHDSIEDARKTYNDIEKLCGNEIADIVYCCTEDKGKTREERHSDKFYEELSKNKLAVFVKLCDIIANTHYSLMTNSNMYEKYKKEFDKTKKYLFVKEYEDMFNYLEKLLTI